MCPEPLSVRAPAAQPELAASALLSPAAPLATPGRPALQAPTKLLLVEFRSGEPVRRHPELQSYLHAGWHIRSAVPRLVEGEGLKLLVVLAHPAEVRNQT